MMTITMDANSFSRDLNRADVLAQDKLESFRLTTTFSPLPVITTENNLDGRFRRTTRVDASESDATVPPRIYRIHVTMNWTDKNGLSEMSGIWTYFPENSGKGN